MTNREDMIRAIKLYPEEDTPRLMYADWLDEQDQPTDQDRARAEFIRLSCRGAKAQHPATGKWLDANWRRLLPTIDRVSDEWAFGHKGKAKRRGRKMQIGSSEWARERRDWERLEVEWWRGFVIRFYTSSARNFLFFAGQLTADEPLAVPVWRSPYIALDTTRGALFFHHQRWGPLFDLIEGHDTQSPQNGEWIERKVFTIDQWGGFDQAHTAALHALQIASCKWVDKNPGKCYTQSRDGTWRWFSVNDARLPAGQAD
jgi:uncharacterized protein (TIGR02996 family)